MGGIIGLTIRKADGTEYRGSCHTNILPYGLWAAPFYVPETSEAHAWAFLQTLLENRRQNPEVEAVWGGHNMLAPIEYGIVIIDYKTSTLVSAQGYSSPHHIFGRHREDPDVNEKWVGLEKAGLLGASVGPSGWEMTEIRLPFTHTKISDVDAFDTDDLQRWCEENFDLSDKEKAEWLAFVADRRS